VLWLAVSLLGTAALYAMLDAPFLAGVQVLTYVGGVVTLMIFGVMVTRRHEGAEAKTETDTDERGFIAAVALPRSSSRALEERPRRRPACSADPHHRARAQLLDEYLLAFEALSLLLLAAIVGAVVLARRRDPHPVTGKEHAATAISQVRPVTVPVREPRPCDDARPLPHARRRALLGRSLRPALAQAGGRHAALRRADGERREHRLRRLRALPRRSSSQIFVLFALAVTVAEVAVGLALVLLLYRRHSETELDLASEAKQ